MADHLQNELVQRYLKRSSLFWKFSREAKFVRWQKEARNAAWRKLNWDDNKKLGISDKGREAAELLGLIPSEVFAHPEVIKAKPELFEYYRLLSCLSAKGLGQIKKALKLNKQNIPSEDERLLRLCRLLNEFLSNALARTANTNREGMLRTIYAEAGSEWQGTWVNQIGNLAAQDLALFITSFARAHDLIDAAKTEAAADEGNFLVLKSGNVIRFASEPDVEIRNANKELICVIEIKGSADTAGAQTRLGETKKSFTKAKLANPRCVTIFLPCVLTAAVEKQLSTERDIDKVFNLLAIFKDGEKRRDFLTELFKFILREPIS